jgi:nucleotide-binding universal stress UspA family protein
MPGVRQLAPAPPFGEEGILVDALVPSEVTLNGDQLRVELRGWHVLTPPPSRILVYAPAADGDAPHPALNTARALAEAIGASITVLGVAQEADHADALRATLEKLRGNPGLERADVKVRTGDALRQIAVEQQESFYELLVLPAGDGDRATGAAQSPRVNRLLVRLLERPATPVLVVGGEPAAQPGFDRMLICTRGGEPGKTDVRVGGWLARRLGAAATLLYVTRGEEDPGPIVRGHLSHAAATLRALDVPAEVRYRPAARPVDGIVEEARSGAHSITVLGSHGPQSRSALSRDDVTLQVINRAPTSVLVVPPEE